MPVLLLALFAQSNEIKPDKTLPVGQSLGPWLTSGDGKSACVLDLGDGTLLIVDLERFRIAEQIDVPRGTTDATVAPSGKVAFTCAGKQITVVSLSDGKCVKSFDVEQTIAALCAVSDDEVYASGDRLCRVSASKQAVTWQSPPAGVRHGRLHFVASRRRVYGFNVAVNLPDDRAGRPEPTLTRFVVYAPFTVSPDGRYAATEHGEICRPARSAFAEMARVAMIERHTTSVFLPRRKRLLTFTSIGEMREYDLETLELVRTWRTNCWVYEAAANEAETHLYAAGTRTTNSETGREARPPKCDLMRFELPR